MPLSAMDRSSRKKIKKETFILEPYIRPNGPKRNKFTEYSTQQQQNTHASQVHMEHSLG